MQTLDGEFLSWVEILSHLLMQQNLNSKYNSQFSQRLLTLDKILCSL